MGRFVKSRNHSEGTNPWTHQPEVLPSDGSIKGSGARSLCPEDMGLIIHTTAWEISHLKHLLRMVIVRQKNIGMIY